MDGRKGKRSRSRKPRTQRSAPLATSIRDESVALASVLTPGGIATSVPPHPSLQKLDPTLGRWAFSAREPLTPGGPSGTRVVAARSPLGEGVHVLAGSQARPHVLSHLLLGKQSLLTQLSPKAARELEEKQLVPVLVEATSAERAKEVRAVAAQTTPLTTTTAAARVTREQLLALAAHPGVRLVEASVRLKPSLDLAHRSAALFQAGARAVNQTGQGVLIGIVDTGIDAAHPGFQVDGSTRIVD